uniref:hypothetical protein n=1 Tax=Prevotella sp. TaxID=59823 RepID=UPI004027EA12
MSENTPTPPTANLFKPSEIIGILRNHLATGHVGKTKTMTVMMPIMIENIRMITYSLSILTNY